MLSAFAGGITSNALRAATQRATRKLASLTQASQRGPLKKTDKQLKITKAK